ncbi:MAG: helix-hairpin-helix domain-containing protein [Dysgonamonadaceae bacterium]|jgi:DNA uptake protein ComE-like DNA-binding protein|nr:helix-hairpin-helix domain-containing protein [Dysgonamonadaceae bacterium]
MWKDFFYFSKRERQGILILIALIAGVFIGKFLFAPKEKPSDISGISGDTTFVKEPYRMQYADNQTSNPLNKQDRRDGLSKQRPKPEEKRTYYQQPEKTVEPPRKNNYPQKEKFPEGTIIELNAGDTAQLMKIPGIGISFARRIISYKKLLGGYYRLQQLQEVYGMYEELYDKITPYLRVDTGLIQPIPVNSVSLDRLKSHPYFNFYQAKAIIDIRKKKGKIDSINELAMLEEFSEEDIEKIRHYLSFQ